MHSSEDQVRQFNPVKDDAWDKCVALHPNASFFHGASWARVLHATYGHVAHHLGILEADRPQALLPLMEVNSPLTGRRGVSLPFADECRLLCRDRASGERIFREALELGRRRCWKLEVRGVDVEGWPASPSGS